MTYKLHTFRPGETISAVIRLLGRHNLQGQELLDMLAEFDRLNLKKVPKPGEAFKIPLPKDNTKQASEKDAKVQAKEEL